MKSGPPLVGQASSLFPHSSRSCLVNPRTRHPLTCRVQNADLEVGDRLEACPTRGGARSAKCSGWPLLWVPLAANAQLTNDIPPLRPPHSELPPTLWEQHGVWIALLGGLLLALAAYAVWRWRRPRPTGIVPIEVQTREELERLRSEPENGRTLSQVSRCVRRYVAVAFRLPAGEFTTAEFCRAVAGQPEIGPEWAEALCGFLRQCDERKFAPAPPSTPLGAVERAARLVEQGEARRDALRRVRGGPSDRSSQSA